MLFANKCPVFLVERSSALCGWHYAQNCSTHDFLNNTTLHSRVWLEIKWHYFQQSMYCSGLNVCEWSHKFGICKYLIVLCTGAFVCDKCVFIASTFQNDLCNECVTILSNGVVLLKQLALFRLQKNVLPHRLVNSTLQYYLLLLHKMFGYEGMISDILTLCWFLISLPFRSIEMVLQSKIHSLCWWIL